MSLVRTHGVRLGGLDVHVARLFDGLHHQFLHGGEETLNIHVGKAKQLRKATAEHDGQSQGKPQLGGRGKVHMQAFDCPGV